MNISVVSGDCEQTLHDLKNNFTKGILKGLAYYAIAFVTAWLTYIIFGWDYKHAPGLHHIVAFLFLLGGAGYTFYYFVLILTGLKSKVNLGLFAVHIVIILTVVLYITVSIRSEDVTEYITNTNRIITINKDQATNTSSIVNGNGDTLYALKGNSIFTNKIKIDTINHR